MPELAMLVAHSKSLNKAWCSEEASGLLSIQAMPSTLTTILCHVFHSHCYSNHYDLEMITSWSLCLYQFGHPGFSLGVSFLHPKRGSICLLKCYSSSKVCFKCSWLCGSSFEVLCWQWFLYSIDHELFVYNDDSLPCTYLSVWSTQVLNKCVRQKEKGKMEERKQGREAGRRNTTCLLPCKYQFWKAKQRTQQDKWMTVVALQT